MAAPAGRMVPSPGIPRLLPHGGCSGRETEARSEGTPGAAIPGDPAGVEPKSLAFHANPCWIPGSRQAQGERIRLHGVSPASAKSQNKLLWISESRPSCRGGKNPSSSSSTALPGVPVSMAELGKIVEKSFVSSGWNKPAAPGFPGEGKPRGSHSGLSLELPLLLQGRFQGKICSLSRVPSPKFLLEHWSAPKIHIFNGQTGML